MRILIGKKDVNYILQFVILFAFCVFGVLVSFNSRDLATRVEIKLLPLLITALVMWAVIPQKAFYQTNNLRNIYLVLNITVALFSIIRLEWSMTIVSIIALFLPSILYKSLTYYSFEITYSILIWSVVLSSAFMISQFGIASFNSQGVIYAFAGIMALNYLCIKRIEKPLVFILIVIITLLVLSITKSRTSMLGFLAVVISAYLSLFFRKRTIRNFFFLIIIIAASLVAYNYLESFFYKVFFLKWGNDDITSNRTYIWNHIWLNKSFLGNGINHLNGGDAHNTLMQVLGVSGVISAFVFLILLIYIVVYTIKNSGKIVYTNFFIGWFIISTFENLDIYTSRMLPVTMLFITHITLLMKETHNGILVEESQ